MSEERTIGYSASPTCARFHYARGYKYRGLRGPVGSGKSVACCMEVFLCANDQLAVHGVALSDGRVPKGGVRWSKFLIGRNTFSNLKDTTVETWLQWFPDTRMHWSSPMTGLLEMPCTKGDGSWIRLEIVFFALESPTIMDDLYSLELSGAWINEASQTQWKVVQQAYSRIGRFQPVKERELLNSFGMIMDTNPPHEDNWWYHKEVEERSPEMAWFVQPPALLRRVDKTTGEVWYEDNEGQDPMFGAAENVDHLRAKFGYWRDLLIGSDEDTIKRLVLNQFGTTSDGKPVYPEWNDAVHVAREEIPYERGLTLLMGTDFGRTPATVFAQMGADGQLRVIDELTAENVSTEGYIEEMLRPKLVNEYGFPMCPHVNWADPAGANPDQVVQMTCIQNFNRYGIRTLPSPVPQNSFELRRDCVSELLRTMLSGRPGVVISPKCRMLRKGFNGNYHYRKMRSGGAGDERFAEQAEKNEYSHPHDAFQYLCYGAMKSGMDLTIGAQGMMSPRKIRELKTGVSLGGFAL